MADEVEVTLDGLDDFIKMLGHHPAVVGICADLAEQVKAEAQATAPYKKGTYHDGIKITQIDTGHRIVHRVEATAPHSIFVEARTGNLARALRKARR